MNTENVAGLSLTELQAFRNELLKKRDELAKFDWNSDEKAWNEVKRVLSELEGVNRRIAEILHADELAAQEREAERKAQENLEREKRRMEYLAQLEEKRELERQAEIQAEIEKENAQKKYWAELDSRFSSRKSFEEIAQEILNTLEKFQIVPSTECVEINDKVVKTIFNLSAIRTNKLLSDKNNKLAIIEKKARVHKGKKKDAIISRYKLQNALGYEDKTPLNEFDRAVLGVIISEYLAGNYYTTINIIFRALIGKVGEVGVIPCKNQKDAIIKAVMRLMARIVDFRSFDASLGKMNYTDKSGNQLKFGVTSLLSAEIVDAKINGQVVEGVIYFLGDSPLFVIADAKSQIIRYPHELLDVPNMNNTPLIITIKKYVMRRICEIKLHKQLIPTITFEDVFTKCRVETTTDRKEIMRRRNYIIRFFEHLKTYNFITDFELVKRGQAFYGVKFSY